MALDDPAKSARYPQTTHSEPSGGNVLTLKSDFCLFQKNIDKRAERSFTPGFPDLFRLRTGKSENFVNTPLL